jgi:predicted enzyme related to lactoylglutathione lyase
MGYVTVADAAVTAAKAKRLGGKVIKDAFDVMDVGSMAVIQDPTGAVFAVWQPKVHNGYDYNDSRIGTACWHELATTDVGRAGKFHSELFSWKRTIMDMGPTPYTIFKIGETQAAGMMEMTGEEWGDVPPG